MSNTATVTGYIGEPDLSYSRDGKPWARFYIRVQASRKDERLGKYPSTFLDCKAFGPIAERIAECFQGRERVQLTGRLEAEEWEAEGSEKNRHKLVLIVEDAAADIRFNDVAISDADGGSSSRAAAPAGDEDDFAF